MIDPAHHEVEREVYQAIAKYRGELLCRSFDHLQEFDRQVRELTGHGIAELDELLFEVEEEIGTA